MNDGFFEVESLVQAFLDCTASLKTCLEGDQAYFAENDLRSLEQSDAKKSYLINQLRSVIEQLDNHASLQCSYGDLLVRLSYYAGTLELSKQRVLLNLIQNMREACRSGVHHLQVNQNVVNTNLNHVKSLISLITANPVSDKINMYGQSGRLIE